MRNAPYRPLTDDELMAWINEQNAKEAQRRTALKAERKEIVKAIQETDSEALGCVAKLFFAGDWVRMCQQGNASRIRPFAAALLD